MSTDTTGASFRACPPRPSGGSGDLLLQGAGLGAEVYGTLAGGTGPSPELQTVMPPQVGDFVPLPKPPFQNSHGAEKEMTFRLRKHWPHYYFLVCLAIFSAPVTAAIHLAMDVNIQFWIGDYGLYAVLVPWLLLTFHYVNLKLGEPRVIPVLATTVAPAIILVVIGSKHLSKTRAIARLLSSKDCTTFDAKRELERSWRVAAGLYEGCVNRTVAEHHLTFAEGMKLIKLQDCIEMTVRKPDIWAHHREAWDYLQRMETEHECSGWCSHTAALWSYQATKDACATTAGNALISRVHGVAKRVQVYAIVLLVLGVVGISQIGKAARRRGKEWAFV